MNRERDQNPRFDFLGSFDLPGARTQVPTGYEDLTPEQLNQMMMEAQAMGQPGRAQDIYATMRRGVETPGNQMDLRELLARALEKGM